MKTTDITHAQVVELITAGRSGGLGIAADPGSNGDGPQPADSISGGAR